MSLSSVGVFTQLIADMGVRDVQVEEVWDFDNIAQLAYVAIHFGARDLVRASS